jgi:hypothetical protein
MLKTKHMMKDIKKLREEDLIVCSDCGSDKISEKIWVDSNSFISLNGDSYYKYITGDDDSLYWCDKCNDMTHPVHISEYKEGKNAEQKS